MGSPFKMNPKSPLMKALVGKQGNLPQHLQDAIKAAPESPARSYGKSPMKKTTDPKNKKKKDTFRYESDMPEVIGTAATKDRIDRVTEYEKGGKTLKKGDTYERGGYQTPKKVVDTGRDASGRKKSGRTGTVDVEVKKGDIRFSTGKKTKKKIAGKSPAQMNGGKAKSKTKRVDSFGPKAKIEKGKNTIPKMKQTKSDLRKNYRTGGKSPAKMKGVKALKK